MLKSKISICIAGKNQCAIDALDFLIKKKKFNLFSLPNDSDTGKNNWQSSFKKFSKSKKIKIVKLSDLCKIKKLFLFSFEYEKIININNFVSKNLYNFHFSLLPKYRGCHTNFLQIFNGEKYSGVTMHKIDNGIDTGEIIYQSKFKININDTGYKNYLRLMSTSVKLFKKNFNNIIRKKYINKKQNLKKGSYFSRDSVNYSKLIHINKIYNNLSFHNKVRALIFPPFQLPIYNGKKIIKSIYNRNKTKIYFI